MRGVCVLLTRFGVTGVSQEAGGRDGPNRHGSAQMPSVCLRSPSSLRSDQPPTRRKPRQSEIFFLSIRID